MNFFKKILNKKRIYTSSYRRVFVLIIVVVAIVLATSSMLLYYSYRSNLLKILDNNLNKSLEQIDFTINKMQDEAKNISLQISIDSEFVGHLYYFNEIKLDAMDYHRITKRLRYYSALNPYIHSVYIYNRRANRFITSLQIQANRTYDEFFDNDIKHILNNFSVDKYMKPITREVPIEPGSNIKKKVMTYVHHETRPNKPMLERAVVINYTQDVAIDALSAMQFPDSYICILDTNGELILSYDNLENNNNLELYKNIDISKNDVSEVIKVNKTKYIISSKYSDNSNMIFVRAIPYDTVYKYNNIIKTLWTILLLFLGGLILAFVVSRIIYRPLNFLKKRTELLEKTVENDFIILKQQFLSRMLRTNSGMRIDDLKNNFVRYNIKWDFTKPVFLIIISIDNYEFLIQNNMPINKIEVLNTALYIFNAKYRCLGVLGEHSNLALISTVDSLEYDREIISELSLEFQDEAKQLFNNTFSISIGTKTDAINKISEMYKDLLVTARFNSYLENSFIVFEKSDEDKIFETEYKYPNHKEKKMIESLNLKDIDSAIKYFNQITDYAKAFSYDILLSAVNRVTVALNAMIKTILVNSNSKLPFNVSSFWSSISSAYSFAEVEEHFISLFDKIITMIDELDSKDNVDIIATSALYIKENYTDESLSSESIASILGISTNYLRRTFKVSKGMSISTYINKIRINKAEELLLNTNMSVKEIALQVGFSNTNYFYTYFKKHHGITPSVFKKLNSNNS